MELLVFFLIAIVLVRWLVDRSRLAALDDRIRALESSADQDAPFQRLTARVWKLEQAYRTPVPPEPSSPEPEPVMMATPPVSIVPPLEPMPEPVIEHSYPPREEFVPPPAPIAEREPEEEPEPVFVEQSKSRPGTDEWEAMVGSSLLNKVGAFILVIGIALFLGYSFAYLSPGGRAAISIALSLALLLSGIFIERIVKYRVFARGLIGAGWAALYASAYACYALPAAQIINDPFTGSVCLLVVAAGMIGHSLLYRSPAVTCIAYFAAFAALAVTPSTPFAVVSLVPLAVSLLMIAHRLEWHILGIYGVAAVYLTCVSRASTDASLWSTMLLLLTYWALFEGFDLLRASRGRTGHGLEWIFPANGVAFLALSFQAFRTHDPENLWFWAAMASVLYGLSALIRLSVVPPSSFEPEETLIGRVAKGSFEASLLVSAVLAGLAIVARVPGLWSAIGLAIEAEILFLAGVRFRSPFLLALGRSAFVSSIVRLWTSAMMNPAETPVLGYRIHNWTPPLLFHAGLFYLNRFLHKDGRLFSYLASGMIALALVADMPERYVGTALLLFSAVLFEFGLRQGLAEFRFQAYGLALGGSIAAALVTRADAGWISRAMNVALAYGSAIRLRSIREERLSEMERLLLGWGSGVAIAVLSSLFVWHNAPEAYFGVCWFGLAVLLFISGLLRIPEQLRPISYAAGFLAAVVVAGTNVISKWPEMEVRLAWFGAAACAWLFTAIALLWPSKDVEENEREAVRDLGAAAGTLFGSVAAWMVLPDALVSPVWAVYALALIELGPITKSERLRWIATCVLLGPVLLRSVAVDNVPATHIVTAAVLFTASWRVGTDILCRVLSWAATFAMCCAAWQHLGPARAVAAYSLLGVVYVLIGTRTALKDFLPQGYAVSAVAFVGSLFQHIVITDVFRSTGERISTAVISIAALYALQVLAPAFQTLFSVAGTLLLSAVLFQEVSGGLLTLAWGTEGLVLLGVGFATRKRVLRLQGLALLLACILKLFLYDLRNLDTFYRILSFIALGVILLGVSWIYTTYRARLQRYFCERSET